MMQKLYEYFKYQIEEEASTTEEHLPSVVTRQHVWPSSERQVALASSYFGWLPNKILVRIFRSLPVYDLINVGLVCRTFKMVADLEEVWKNKRRTIPHIPLNARWTQNGVTITTSQLKYPCGLYVDDDETVLIADSGNDRIAEWKSGATSGQGNLTGKLRRPLNVIADKETDSLIICENNNLRVMMQWSRRSRTDSETIIRNIDCHGLAMDDERFLYVSDYKKDEVRRYRVGETNGILVAGGNGRGHHLNQLNCPYYVFVDRNHSVYVSDSGNHRVMKWMKGAKEGIVVAGGQGTGNALTQLSWPKGMFVDSLGTVYVADEMNHRIMRWYKGKGNVIVGGNGGGQRANQLYNPMGLSFDRHGNLYVAEYGNHRVQKFSIEKTN